MLELELALELGGKGFGDGGDGGGKGDGELEDKALCVSCVSRVFCVLSNNARVAQLTQICLIFTQIYADLRRFTQDLRALFVPERVYLCRSQFFLCQNGAR